MMLRLISTSGVIAALALSAAAVGQAPAPRLKPPVPNTTSFLSDADFANFRRGMRAAEDDDWDAVRAARLAIRDEVASDLLLWRIAVSDMRAPFSELDRAVDELADWPRSWTIQREAEWKITDSGFSPSLIVNWFANREPVSGEGRVALGEALIAIGQSADGAAQIRDAWRNQSLRLTDQARVLRAHGELFSQEDHAARVDFLLWANQRTAASQLLSQLSPAEQRLATARIQLAARSSGVNNAVNAVPASLANNPGLVFERARWRRRAGLDTALPLLLELPGQHANPTALSAMWGERKLIILDLIRDGDYQTAYELAAANGMSSGVDFADAEFLAGWLALTETGHPELALDHFNRLEAGVTTPVSLGRAKYWQGRAAEAAGNLDLARERFLAAAEHITTYYGQMALIALGPESADLVLPPDPVPSEAERRTFEARPLTRALRLLAAIDADYYFRVFIYDLDDRMETPAEQAMLADIALDYFRIRDAVRAAKAGRLQGMILPDRAYPLIDVPDNVPVRADVALTHALIRQETEFDPRAVSSVGARGMMQMMPATARETARQLGQPYNFAWLTDDPNYNLMLGMAHLDEVLNDYDGSLVMALAAYNAGGSRVTRWVENYGDPRTGEIDPIDWVERIPFSETRNYVQRILENLQIYRARLSADGTAPIEMERDMVGYNGVAAGLPALPRDFLERWSQIQAELPPVGSVGPVETGAAQDAGDEPGSD